MSFDDTNGKQRMISREDADTLFTTLDRDDNGLLDFLEIKRSAKSLRIIGLECTSKISFLQELACD